MITGARQVGKTSLVRRLFAGHSYVTLDLPALAAQAETDPTGFLREHPPPLVVDEAQYAPGLFRHIKRDIDRHREDYGRFVLSGSQKFRLMGEVSDSLAGRVAIFELEPLSVREIRRTVTDLPPLPLIVRGGYPELYENRAVDATGFYSSYVATYLERDVRSLLRVGSLRDFDRFLRACAFRSGQLLNKSDLARDVGISPSTANEWLSVLERSNQIVLLEPWFMNRTRSMTRSPKLYLTDTGLLCFFLSIRTASELERSPSKGAVWETFVLAELRKRQQLIRPGDPIYFWRDRGKEVDFLMHRGGTFEVLEARWTPRPTAKDTNGFESLGKFLGADRIESRRIVCRTEASHLMPDGTRVVGLADRWLEDEDEYPR